MSAFILGHKHINALVNYAYNHDMHFCHDDIGYNGQTDRRAIGQTLMNENHRSVNYRYEENDTPREYVFKFSDVYYSSVQLLKACDCYDYQSCETPDYRETFAAKIVQGIRKHVIRNIEGYNDAMWEIS